MKKSVIAIVLLCFVVMNSYSVFPTNGLIGKWSFSGNAQDEIGGNNGVVNGASLCADRFGKANSAYYFDGIDDNISLLFPNPIDINTTCSIMLWFKADLTQNSYAKLLCVPYSLDTWTSPYHYLAFSGPAFNYANFDPTNGMCDTRAFTEAGDTKWTLLTFTYDNGNINIYINDQLKESISCTNKLLPAGYTMSIGSRSTSTTNDGERFTGIIDDLSIYNRALSSNEITQYYLGCAPKETNQITSYIVSDKKFKEVNSKQYLDSTAIKTTTEGCDSIVKYYTEYKYLEDYHTDTLTINDTVIIKKIVIVNDTVSVTDTLFIDVTFTNINNQQEVGKIKVYPNPTKDKVYIDLDNKYQQISDFSVRVVNTAGTQVFESKISKSQFSIDLSDFGKTGLFYIQILDNNGKVVEYRKIVLK